MPCYHPLKAWPIGRTAADKTAYKITSYEVDHLECLYNGTFEPSSISFRSSRAVSVIDDYIEIPCGKCIGCRLAYSRAWADRCMLELADHESSYFVTLTYEDSKLPRSWYSDPKTGEAFEAYTLRKRDLQLFHKRLRKALDGEPIRYFACGEYGDNTLRPHYHDIIFGLKLDDLKFYSRSRLGYNYYNSEFLSRVWNNGYVVVGKVNWDTCAYTARYVVKKLKGAESSFYSDHNIEPPFVVMSRKPGIARKYYDEHPELFDHPCVYISTEQGGHPVYPSRYYKQLFDLQFPEKSVEMKARNKEAAIIVAQNKLLRTDKDYLEYLKTEEVMQEQKLKSLPRAEF